MSENIHYRLIIRRGPQPNQSFELAGPTVTLGRDIINDITISDPEVSRQHCHFIKSAEGYTLRDLGSTNGTFVNGERLEGDHPLKNGDRIGFGETVLMSYMAQALPDVPRVESSIYQPTVAPDEATTEMPAMPMPTTEDIEDGVAVDPTPTGPPAYMYQPPAIEAAPEVSRVALLGCGLLTALCLVGIFTSFILIDASDSWNDVPVIGGLFESAPVAMDTIETNAFQVPVPRDWERAVLDFEDVSIIITSPDSLPYESFETTFSVDFENDTGVMIVEVQGNHPLSPEGLQNRMLTANGLTNLNTTPETDSVTIDGREGTRVTLAAPASTAAEGQSEVQIIEVENGDDKLYMVMLSSGSESSREIFDYMVDTLQFASED
ncbi:MAG: FHA domain-containing protein [Chloroflexi bacterium]|nr:FHA domain-containing protein [Chloroflexota bacterium]